MQRKGFCRWAVVARAVVATLAGGGALAQPVAPARAVSTPCIAPAATAKAGFNAVGASDTELRLYGFPPRPNALRDPVGFAHWAAAVGAGPTRVVPQLVETTIHHGPRITASGRSNDTLASSTNWSGIAVSTGAARWGSDSLFSVAGTYIVPSVSTSTCNNTWEYASVWTGIDGNASPDVLQAGIEADAFCGDGGASSYFAPWYEWYPNAEIRITNLTAAAGQSFYVHVWATSATVGNAWVQNLSTNEVAECTFTAPAGTALRGESAEWIVESPSVNGGLATLPEYGRDYFVAASAATLGNVSYYPSSAATTVLSLVRNGVTYSAAAVSGPQSILFTSH